MADKIQSALIRIGLRSFVWVLVSCLALFSMSLSAQAAGLGKITVFSSLGQPLRAAIELSATREELFGMKAQLASHDAFRMAGLDYTTTLSGIRLSIDKHATGQPLIALSSDKPVIDPFVDMLLELNWTNGRLVRKYTFLLDPPELADGHAVAEWAASSVGDNAPQPRENSRASARGRDSHRVSPGETLGKIAFDLKPEGVSLEQMLVGLFRANRDAFEGSMNRLKVGGILSVPEKSDLESISTSEAKKLVLALLAEGSGNAAHRNRSAVVALAEPGKEEGGKRRVVANTTPLLEAKAAPGVEPKYRLKISKAEAASAKRTEEDPMAGEKALRVANDRVSELEKTVEDLQKIVEQTNRSLAALQMQLAAKAASVDPERQEPVAKSASAEAQQPKQKEIIRPAVENSSVVEVSIDSTMLLAAVGGILALLTTFWLIKRRYSGPLKDELSSAVRSVLSARRLLSGESTLEPPRGGSSPGPVVPAVGQSIDTSYAPPPFDLSPAGPESIATDEVDLLAEADVYLACGHDAQAEEILLEAKQKDPKRHAIHLRLLYLYAKQHNVDRFKSLATDFHAETRGVGAEWEKAAAMGLQLDPENSLFGGGVALVEPVEPAATVPPTPNSLEFGRGAVEQAKAVAEPLVITAPVMAPVVAAPAVVVKAIAPIKVELLEVAQEVALEEAPLDFNLGYAQPPVVTQSVAESGDVAITEAPDFKRLDTPAPAVEAVLVVEPTQSTNSTELDFDLAFDVKLSESTVLGQTMQSPALDTTPISLDLDSLAEEGASTSDRSVGAPADAFDFGPDGLVAKPPAATPTSTAMWHRSDLHPSAEVEILFNEQVAIKLDLANAYEEMGDPEGACELLREVLREGNATQRDKAQAVLARIASTAQESQVLRESNG